MLTNLCASSFQSNHEVQAWMYGGEFLHPNVMENADDRQLAELIDECVVTNNCKIDVHYRSLSILIVLLVLNSSGGRPFDTARTEVDQGTDFALWRSCHAYCTPVMNQQMWPESPFLLGNELYQIPFDFLGVLILSES